MLGVLAGVLLTLLLVYGAVQWAVVALSLKPIRVHQFVSPGMMGYPQTEFAVTTGDGVRISGWDVSVPGDVVVVACHGYLLNRCEWVPVSSFLVERGVSMVFFDHRGQGRSGSAKVTLGRDEARDVLAVLGYVRERHEGKKVVLLGSSMGAVAAALAAEGLPQGSLAAMVLDAPYRNLVEATQGWWPFLGGRLLEVLMAPTRFLGPLTLGFRPESVQVDEALSRGPVVPVLLMYGTEDPIVPRASAEAMAMAAPGPAELVWFEGATHGAGRLLYPELFQSATLDFLERHGILEKRSEEASRPGARAVGELGDGSLPSEAGRDL